MHSMHDHINRLALVKHGTVINATNKEAIIATVNDSCVTRRNNPDVSRWKR